MKNLIMPPHLLLVLLCACPAADDVTGTTDGESTDTTEGVDALGRRGEVP